MRRCMQRLYTEQRRYNLCYSALKHAKMQVKF
jgi:hypothetical protein